MSGTTVRFTIGKLIQNWNSSLPEGIQYNYTEDTHNITISFDNIQPEELEDFNYAPVEFGLRMEEGIVTILIKIGRIGWGTAFFNWWINKPEKRTFPKVVQGERQYLVGLIFVERSTGILKAYRQITWSSDFQSRICEEIRRQITHPEYENQQWYSDVVKRFYKRYPNIEEMLDDQILVRCLGGNPGP
jgi:hypothetical protein